MATLNVAAHSRMNSRSSMPNRLWNVVIGGTVDSPTPTVPISSDSTSVMSSSCPNCFDSAIAVTQPAVPPPAMTTFLTALEFAAASALFIGNPLRARDYAANRGDLGHGEPELCADGLGVVVAECRGDPLGPRVDLGELGCAEPHLQRGLHVQSRLALDFVAHPHRHD